MENWLKRAHFWSDIELMPNLHLAHLWAFARCATEREKTDSESSPCWRSASRKKACIKWAIGRASDLFARARVYVCVFLIRWLCDLSLVFFGNFIDAGDVCCWTVCMRAFSILLRILAKTIDIEKKWMCTQHKWYTGNNNNNTWPTIPLFLFQLKYNVVWSLIIGDVWVY